MTLATVAVAATTACSEAGTQPTAVEIEALLVLGAVLGIAIDRHFLSRDHVSAAAAFHDMAMSSLEERLDLTAEQRRQVDSIVASRHNTLRHAWQALHSQLGAAVDTVHDELEAILTPEQRAEFRSWLREVVSDR